MTTKDLEVLGSPGATEDLENIQMTWTDYGEIADDRAVWKSCVGQCVPRTRRRTLTSKLVLSSTLTHVSQIVYSDEKS